MQKMFSALFLMGVLMLSLLVPMNSAFAQPDKVNVLIGFNGKPDVSLITQHGGKIKSDFSPFINVISASLPSTAIQGLENNPKISYIESDLVATIHYNSLYDAEYPIVWGVDHINADLVHKNIGLEGTGIKVAVIDTGINSNHQDLSANYKGGKNYVDPTKEPIDDHGHGSHVSGTIAGVAANGGIIGVSPQIDLYGVKVLDSSGSGSYSNVIAGIKWAADNKMDVANLSLGGGSSTSLCNAVTSATNSGVLIIASAGNSGNPKGKGTNTGYPATCIDAIAVAATTKTDSRASFSSTGPAVEISAPGSGIYSSVLGSSYATWSGTSMAAPHVSGVAALIKNANSNLSPQEIRTILQDTAIDLGDSGRDTLYGFGLVNPVDAVASVNSNPVLLNPDFTIVASPKSISVNQSDPATVDISLAALNGYDKPVTLSTTQGTLSSAQVNVNDPAPQATLTLNTETIGTQKITVTASDDSLTHDATIDLIVLDPTIQDKTISIDNVSYAREGGRNGDKHLVISVSLIDESGPVSGVEVHVEITCDCSNVGWIGTGAISDSTGVATYTLNNAKSGTYTTKVTNVLSDNWDGVQFTYSSVSSKSNSSNGP